MSIDLKLINEVEYRTMNMKYGTEGCKEATSVVKIEITLLKVLTLRPLRDHLAMTLREGDCKDIGDVSLDTELFELVELYCLELAG